MNSEAEKAAQRNRNTIFVETGEILQSHARPGNQYIQRIRAPRCAAAASAGSFVHITCDDELPMRRPLSIMRSGDDWIEILYKTHGTGLRLLARKSAGDPVSIVGPIGVGFSPDRVRPKALLIGGGVGIPPIVFLADELRKEDRWQPFAILGSEIPFPFELARSSLAIAGMPDGVTSAMPQLEAWGIPSRLTSLQGYDGCHPGYVTDLAELMLRNLSADERSLVSIYSCGPAPMLRAVAELAARFAIPCQVSLEEFMACAVGGCAGCGVLVQTADGPAMKRVCVDGPVFDAATIVW